MPGNRESNPSLFEVDAGRFLDSRASKRVRLRRALKNKRRKREAIVEIVSVLLLITVAVAAATIVYAYVVGFVGTLSSNTIQTISIISIDDACVSATSGCSTPYGSSSFFVVVRNSGSISLSIAPSSEPQVYLTDNSIGISATFSCNAPRGIVSQGQTFTCYCPSGCSFGTSRGDLITVKVVDPDGGIGQTTFRAL